MMGIWLELGIFVLVIVFAVWQIRDVRKAQEKTRQQRHQDALPTRDADRSDRV